MISPFYLLCPQLTQAFGQCVFLLQNANTTCIHVASKPAGEAGLPCEEMHSSTSRYVQKRQPLPSDGNPNQNIKKYKLWNLENLCGITWINYKTERTRALTNNTCR